MAGLLMLMLMLMFNFSINYFLSIKLLSLWQMFVWKVYMYLLSVYMNVCMYGYVSVCTHTGTHEPCFKTVPLHSVSLLVLKAAVGFPEVAQIRKKYNSWQAILYFGIPEWRNPSFWCCAAHWCYLNSLIAEWYLPKYNWAGTLRVFKSSLNRDHGQF